MSSLLIFRSYRQRNEGNVIVTDEKGERYQIPDIVVELDDENGKLVRRVASESTDFMCSIKCDRAITQITIPPEALGQSHSRIAPANSY